jgi:spore maturation protein CgeB
VYNPVNYLFIFDRALYRRIASLGLPHVYYLPMAANTDRIQQIAVAEEDVEKYSHDISFVGNLYEKNAYNNWTPYLPEIVKLEWQLWLLQNICHWEKVRPWPSVSERALTALRSFLGPSMWNTSDIDDATYYGILCLSRKLAEVERIQVLQILAENYAVDFYTGSSSKFLDKIRVHPGVDYYSVMCRIFFFSKINLNITLPTIETGIPQRVFDIMGCGGFALSNYQEEMEEHFDVGREIETFRSIEELKDKAAYYLTHETERLRIAVAGRKKVCEQHSYSVRIRQMFQMMNAEV